MRKLLVGLVFAGSLFGQFIAPIFYDSHAQSNWDPYITATSPSARAFFNANVKSLSGFSPYFDQTLAWFPAPARVYVDISVLYTSGYDNDVIVAAHPTWIMRDGSGNPLFHPAGGEYAANIANPAFRAWMVGSAGDPTSRIYNYIRGLSGSASRQYDGVFMDDVNTAMTVVNGAGTPVAPIDTNTGVAMTQAAWSGYMRTLVQAIRTAYPTADLEANTVWFSGAAASDIDAIITASSRIVCERGFGDTGLTGGAGGSLRAFQAYIDHVHALGRPVNILDYYAGVGGDPDNLHYSTAGYLMTWTANDHLGFLDLTPDPAWFPVSLFNMQLGTPTAARAQPNAGTYPGLWKRVFQNGVVLFNEVGAGTITYPLGGTYQDETGATLTSVTLGAMQGKILTGVGACSPGTITPYINVNGTGWVSSFTASVAPGNIVDLGPQPLSGTWAWVGPAGFTATSRGIFGIPLRTGASTFTATYTDAGICPTPGDFIVTIAQTGPAVY